MIDERDVFERFHEALDAQPELGAFDRLQTALVQRPVMSPRQAWTVRPVPRTGLTLAAAGLIAVLLTLAIAGAFLAVHLRASRPTPAKPSTTTLTGQLYGGWPRMVTPTTGWSSTPTGFSHTTDGGATWQSVRPPQINPATDDVRASYFLDADHAWIAAVLSGAFVSGHVSMTVFATADGGRTWTAGGPVPPGYGTGSVPFAGPGGNVLDFLDARVGWLLTASDPGQQTVRLYGTTDGGRTWHLVVDAANSDGSALPTLGHGCFEAELQFVSANLGWISYDCIAPTQAGQPGNESPASGPEMAVTKDGGRSWQQVSLPRDSTGHSLCSTTTPTFYSSGQVIVSGVCYRPSQATGGVFYVPDFADGRTAIYITSDAGLSWSLRSVPGGFVPAFTDANAGWLMRWPGDVFRTSDGGTTWKLVGSIPVGSSNAYLALQAFDSHLAIALTGDMSGLLTNWKTTDGGRTWVRVSGPSPTS